MRIAAEMAESPLEKIERVKARRLDRVEQATLVAAWEAWRHAGEPGVPKDRLAVVVGSGIGGAGTLLAQDDILEARGRGGCRRTPSRC